MIRCLKTFDVGIKPRQARSVELMIGGEAFMLFCVSENLNLDPWPEAFGYIDHPLALMLFDEDGNKRWERVFGRGTVPGIWFSPLTATAWTRSISYIIPTTGILLANAIRCWKRSTPETVRRWRAIPFPPKIPCLIRCPMPFDIT